MLVFADPNTATSLNGLCGPNWQIFLQPASFNTENIDINLDSLLLSHLGVLAASSTVVSATRAIKFAHKATSMPNPRIGREETLPIEDNLPLYRVGIIGISAIDLSDVDKMRLLFDNNTQFSKVFSVNDPKAVITLDLVDSVAVDKVQFSCSTSYSIECFTTEWIPFVVGTECSKLRITIATPTNATVTASNIVVYTRDGTRVVEGDQEAVFAVIISNVAQTLPMPAIVVDVSNWNAVGTLKLNFNQVGAAQCPTLLNLSLKPVLLEA